MDYLTKEQRHKNMAANKGKGTKLELLFGKLLWNAGVRYRKNDTSVFGKPDFVIKGHKIAIFCDGEFWHGKDWEDRKQRLKRNREYWIEKIEENMKRDKRNDALLEADGWYVIHFWEKMVLKETDYCVEFVKYIVRSREE